NWYQNKLKITLLGGRLAGVLAMAATALMLNPLGVAAQSMDPLTVSPAIISEGLQAGDQRSWDILLINSSLQPRRVFFTVKAFEAIEGEIRLSAVDQAVSSWLTVNGTEFE